MSLTGREVNLLLEFLMVALIASGLASWLLALDKAAVATTIHGIAGIMLILVMPFKVRGPVKAGFKRRRLTRWVSSIFGVLVLSAAVLGFLHATGIWWGIGYWQPMWTHLLFGFLSIPLFLWHVITRPARPGRTDLNRRALLRSSAVLAGGVTLFGAQAVTQRVVGARSAERAGTGSHEIASFEPQNMPRKIWLNDSRPRIAREDWDLRIEGVRVDLDELARQTSPLDAWLDCTDGWRSEQRWDVVPLSAVLSDTQSRSVKVTSATGYSRLFGRSDVDEIYLCVGYAGEPLRGGHGAPVRIVAPNRRGPWWIKWVTKVELSDRPAWLQSPLPTS